MTAQLRSGAAALLTRSRLGEHRTHRIAHGADAVTVRTDLTDLFEKGPRTEHT
ncbi:hypothetical protein OG250_46540 [Streptomyces sp. NBC_00487]|uniref:hypothetical protein n=1 Tax=unclassified Streptomyces TaxID=2593676 RepID=UPI002E18DE4E|nr:MULTISPECIES: hypothetical protein [unclassified Streptomyces]